MSQDNRKPIKPVSMNKLAWKNMEDVKDKLLNADMDNESLLFRFGLACISDMPPEEMEAKLTEFKSRDRLERKTRAPSKK
ncbi:hypothetical protein [Aliivibrio salmonicida]|uniref:hypothetical protein n=1 Tax=Aliivibrio salmonicida TaxID=40269 RepID=UPI003D0D77C3